MDPIELFQKILRILFYVLVAGALIGFAAERWFDTPNVYWMWCGLGAIGASIMRFVMRFM